VTAAGGVDALRDTEGRDVGGREVGGRDADDRAVVRAGDELTTCADGERAGDEDAKEDEIDGEELAGICASAAGRDVQPALTAKSSSASAHRSNLIMGPSWRSADGQAIRRTGPAMPSGPGDDRAVLAGESGVPGHPGGNRRAKGPEFESQFMIIYHIIDNIAASFDARR
jgi:hypothetical protein